jgi:hypothetical protein
LTTRIKWLSVLLVVAISWSPTWSYSFAAPQYAEATAFSADDLNEMLAPIALYPDPLLAQLLPAASFGDQIGNAEHLLNGHVNEGLIEGQNWDVSVKAIAHYPQILSMMAENPEWTAALGQAFVTQEGAIAQSIQYLRQQALNSGALQSSPQLSVIVNAGYIRIVPAQAQVIYVPKYNPSAIWGYQDIISTPAPANGLIGFGTGLLIGSWLNRDWDWSGRGPYYHGWNGGGWVGASRTHVNITHNYYVNNRFTNINVNRNVDRQNTRDFRERVHREAATRAKPSPTPAAPAPPPEVKKGRPAPPEAAPLREKPAPAPHPPAEVKKAPPAPTPAPHAKPAPAPKPAPEVRKAPPAPTPAAPAPTPRAKPAPAPRPAPEVRKAPPAPTPAAPVPTPRTKPAPAPRPAPEVRKAPPAPTPAAPVPTPRAKPAPAPRPAPEVRKAPPAPTPAAPAPTPRAKPAPAPQPPAAKSAPAPQKPQKEDHK